MKVAFTVYCTPQPQGSMKSFVVPGKNGHRARAVLTSDNTKLKPFRAEVSRSAMIAMRETGMAMAVKHEPVELRLEFVFRKPRTAPRERTLPVVKPDLSKLYRATEDALTGIAFHDDAQVVQSSVRKRYGPVEGVTVRARTV